MAQEIKDQAAATQAAPSTAPVKITYQEFLAAAGENTFAEWVDGEVFVMSPASQRHQLIASFLTALLQHFVESQQAGVVLTAPFQMKLATRPSGREPDVLFVARERLECLTDNFLDGPADIAVEIISPESRARDRGDKFYEYEQGGVREYWLIDPVRKQAEFYLLGDDGIYRPALIGEDGIFRSRVLRGLELKVAWLWQEPLPPLLSVLREWKII